MSKTEEPLNLGSALVQWFLLNLEIDILYVRHDFEAFSALVSDTINAEQSNYDKLSKEYKVTQV